MPDLKGRRRRAAPAETAERGSVTAEFALALPAVVLVLLLVLGLGMHGAARVSVEEGARIAARELARGTSADTASRLAREAAGQDSSVHLGHEGEYAVVTLRRPVQVLGLLELTVDHEARAHVRIEQLPGAP